MADQGPAEEAKQVVAPATEGKHGSVRVAIISTSVILWVLAIWMINVMNSMSAKLDDIWKATEATNSVLRNRPPVEATQVLDKDGEIVYTFKVKREPRPDLTRPGDMVHPPPPAE